MCQTKMEIPFYLSAVSAGFPSPAENEMGSILDLNALLIKRPAATFFVRVAGSSMINAGIHHDDILIVDRSLTPADGKVVIASINGELLVKRIRRRKNKTWLVADSEGYPPIELTGEMDLRIWGVVTNVIHPL